MAKAISNATVLIFLAKLNRFDLLWKRYDEIFIPSKVREEILSKEDPVLKEVIERFKIKDPKKKRDLNLGSGETDSILLCKEERISDFLSDDKRARSVARILKINTIGTLGILLWNLQKGYLTKQECKDLVEQLMRNHYYISTSLYATTLKLIEEKAKK